MNRAAWFFAFLLPGLLSAQTQKPFDVWALHRIVRISEPQLSPDGSTVAFVAERVLLSSNSKQKQIYTVPIGGGAAKQITFFGDANQRPRWSPDSARLAFVSDRSGKSQIWITDADGGNARQVTDLPTEADGVLYAPDGAHLVFTSRVFPQCGGNMDCNKQELAQREENPVKAHTYDRLLYRHWTEWDDGRRSHLFAVPVEGGAARDLTPGNKDVPPFSLGGPDAYAISPDGKEVCFTMIAGDDLATSTNSDLYVVPIEGGVPSAITTNPAADTSPVYSPDGNSIAYRAQLRPGYESDRFRLLTYNRATAEVLHLTESFDRWVTSMTWSPDSTRLFFTAEDRGREPIYTVPATGGGIRIVVHGDAHHGDVQLAPDGKSMIYSGSSGSHPAAIFHGFSTGGQPVQLTRMNDDVMKEFALVPVDEVSYQSTDGARIEGFLVKPPDFDRTRKYPLLVLIHGGPQGAWGESWSYRWNPQVFAAAGYVVFMPNPRGSTGYGQSFIDGINGEWGGLVFDDIMSGVDSMVRQPYIDSQRLVAAGASYGGYMINWMLGHTSRFRAFVSHAGVYDLHSMFGSTEEMWFPLWEFDGAPWENPEMYEKWSPSNFVEKFQTPTLVVHGEKDYRVPVSQAMQLFTALQLRKVPSKFLYFPDEGHWILKPRNSVHWYQSVIDWLNEWTGRPWTPPAEAPSYRRPAPPASIPPTLTGPAIPTVSR